MKFVLVVALCLLPFASTATPPQDDVDKRRDTVKIVFLSDCNLLVFNSRGRFYIKSAHHNQATFRAWQPLLQYGQEYATGAYFYHWVDPTTRDFLMFTRSSYSAIWGGVALGVGEPWSYIVHYNENSGDGRSNAGAVLEVSRPCDYVMLFDGRARITHNGETFDVEVVAGDYVNYPPWKLDLR